MTDQFIFNQLSPLVVGGVTWTRLVQKRRQSLFFPPLSRSPLGQFAISSPAELRRDWPKRDCSQSTAACYHFSIFIGSFLYQRAKPPQGTVLFINLLGNGLTLRVVWEVEAPQDELLESQTYFSMYDTPWSSWCALLTRTCFCQTSSEFYFIIFFLS